jgi:hypothetical protein
VVAVDDIVGENSGHAGEEVPSSVPELHKGSADIRLCLISDRKHMSRSSPVSVEITRGMRGGGWSSCLMIVKLGAKEARWCEECLCQSNRQMAEPVIG